MSAVEVQNNSANVTSQTNKTDSQPLMNSFNTPSASVTTANTTQYFDNPNFTSVHGYFVTSEKLDSLDSKILLNTGITDLFVLTSRNNPDNTLLPFLQKFNGTGIRIHAWVSSFKDFNGNWFYPDEQPELTNQIVDLITSLANNYNVDGILLDYLRYPGNAFSHPNAAQYVTSFVKNIYDNINTINSLKISGKPNILLSATVMPDGATEIANEMPNVDITDYFYGQNLGQLSAYVDFLVPMIYKGNYQADTNWIGIATQYIIENAEKPVVVALQTYRSDADLTPLPSSELINDIKTAQENGSYGHVLFKYGLISQDFRGLPPEVTSTNPASDATGVSLKSPVTITFSENLLAGANYSGIYLKNTVSGAKVTMTKSISGNTLTIQQLTTRIKNTKYQVYIPAGAVKDSAGNNLAAVYTYYFTTLADITPPTQPPTVTASPVGGTYNSAQVVTLTTTDPDSTATTYYTTDGSDPKTSMTRINYTSPIQLSASKVLRFSAVDPDGNWSPNYTETYTINIPATVTIDQLKAAALYVKTYYESNSKTLPASLQINGNTISMPQFLYLLTAATIQINNNNLSPITIKTVNSPTAPSGSFTSGNIQKVSFITYAQGIQSYINTNGRAPNYSTTSLGRMPFKYLVYMYSKIINYYANNNRLPTYVVMSP